MAKPKPGVLTHAEVIDARIAMNKLVELNNECGCTVQSAVVKLDLGRKLRVSFDKKDCGYEVRVG